MGIKAEIGQLIYRIIGDDSGIKKSLGSTEKKAKKTGATLSKIFAAVSVAAVGSKLLGFFKSSVDAASALQEETQKFGVVFSEVFRDASLAARDLAENYGLSERVAKEFLSTNANIATSMGLSQDVALDFSNSIAELGVDLASFTNFAGGTEGAINALSKAILTGEREALKGLGISVLEQDLKDFAFQSGKVFEAMNKQEKATLSLQLVTKLAGNAVGDFSRSADGWANVQRRVEAAVEDTSAKIGQELLPGLSKLGIALLDANKEGSVLSDGLRGIAKGINFVIEGIADQINHQTKLLEMVRKQNDETFRTEKQIEATKEQMQEYGIELAKAAGQQGTATQGMLAFDKALAKGDIDARRLNDAVKDLGEDLETLKFQAEAIVDPLAATNRVLSSSFKLAREQAAKQRKWIAATQKARQLAFDKRIANMDAEVQLAALSGNEILAIELANEKRIVELQNDKLLSAKNKRDLEVAYNKQTEDQIFQYKLQKSIEFANLAIGSAQNLFGALSALSQAQTQNRLDDIDIQTQKALEAAGVAEETALEKAEKELQLAKDSGDQELIDEKNRLVDREKILAKFDKKRRQAEYEGALTAWQFQLASAIAQAPVAILNAMAAGYGAGFPAGPVLGPALAAVAGVASAAQIAAVSVAKPQPPKFASGGIIPGSTSGTTITAGENNQAEGIFNQAQMRRLLDIADGNTGGMTKVSLSRDIFMDELFEASQDGRLLIADKAVVST